MPLNFIMVTAIKVNSPQKSIRELDLESGLYLAPKAACSSSIVTID